MKTKSMPFKNLSLIVFYSLFISIFVSCTSPNNDSLPDPKIEAGIAKVYGKIINFKMKEGQEDLSFTLEIPNPITVSSTILECQVDADGSFYFETPIEFTPVMGQLSSRALDGSSLISLTSDKDVILELDYDKELEATLNRVDGLDLLQDNLQDLGNIMVQMFDIGPDKKYKYINRDSVNRFIKYPKDLIPYLVRYDLGQRLEVVKDNNIVSEKGKTYITNEFKRVYIGEFFEYSAVISKLYNATREKSDTTSIIPKSPDISYYSFLKECDLNNPQYIYTTIYAFTYQDILSNKTINIADIGDTPIDQWIEETKKILVDLVGFDDGLFYDVLIGNAYSRQFVNRLKPLSDKQQQNIKEYFKGGEVEKILLRKNDAIIELDKKKAQYCDKRNAGSK